MAAAKGKSGLITYSSMVNLLLRYPGRYVRPYVGIGGGSQVESSVIRIFPVGNDKNIEMASAPGHQFFGGVQLVIANQMVYIRRVQIQCCELPLEPTLFELSQ